MSLLTTIVIIVSAAVGLMAAPLGILPSVFLFRDLANGIDSSATTKKLYAFTFWIGLVGAWLLGSIAVFWFLSWILD